MERLNWLESQEWISLYQGHSLKFPSRSWIGIMDQDCVLFVKFYDEQPSNKVADPIHCCSPVPSTARGLSIGRQCQWGSQEARLIRSEEWNSCPEPISKLLRRV